MTGIPERNISAIYIYIFAWKIYEYIELLGGNPDSVSRDALFNYASESLGVPYETLHDSWLDRNPLLSQGNTKGIYSHAD